VLKQARGEYFIWASDDDLWDTRFLKDCLHVFENDPELVMVFAGMIDIDKNGNKIKDIDPKGYMPLSRNLYERLKEHMLFYMDEGKLQLLFGLWKKSVLPNEPLFGYRPERREYYWGFDNYFVLRKDHSDLLINSDFSVGREF
jgi:hypothetical protein